MYFSLSLLSSSFAFLASIKTELVTRSGREIDLFQMLHFTCAKLDANEES